MRIFALVLTCTFACGATAAPAVSGTTGNVALPLAAVVGIHEPSLSSGDKKALADLFDAQMNFYWPIGRKITVQADAVVCRASNVDITARTCDLTFGKRKVTVKGRPAHEIFAIVAEAGVGSEGAAGTVYESVSHLRCIVDPKQVFDRAGAGADCTFKPGPP